MVQRHLILALLLLSSPSVASADPHTVIEFDLAGRGEEETQTVKRGQSYQLNILNLLPGSRYSVSVETRLPPISPLSIEFFSFGGQSIAAAESMQEDMANIRAARSVRADNCPTVSAFPRSALSKSNEAEIRELITVSRINVIADCEDKLEQAISSLTTRTTDPTPEVKKEQEVVITITGPGRTWTLVLTPGRGSWQTSYGFTFVPNIDDRFVTEPAESQEGMFVIERQADREDLDFAPSIFFSFQKPGRRFGPAFGLGYDLENVALFTGIGYTFHQNIMLTAGLAIHEHSSLAGRFEVGDILGENLESDLLVEESFEPNFYFGATFRFGENIFARREATRQAVATERSKARAAAVQQAAALELCLKQADEALAKAEQSCAAMEGEEQEACLRLKRAEHQVQQAKCRKDAAEGTLSQNPNTSDDGKDSNQDEQSAARAEARPRAERMGRGRCGTRPLEPQERARVQARTNDFQDLNPGFSDREGLVIIPVRFHVIHDRREGLIDVAVLDRQIDILNGVFEDLGFVFYFENVDFTDNATWFRMGIGSAEEAEAKTALQVDPERTLNFYTADIDFLGWATLPAWLAEDPELDGVVLDYREALPDSPEPFDLGYTGVHEVGHWLGLEHTFNGWDQDKKPLGGCEPPGDAIEDTPFEGSPVEGPGVGKDCPALGSRDTCEGQPGVDPIDNFMDYADDRCMTNFTRGQVAWMKDKTATYRSELFSRATGALKTFVQPQ